MSAWNPRVCGRSTAPADLALGRQALAMLFGHVTGAAEGVGDQRRVALRILRPRGGIDAGIDPDDSIRPHTQRLQFIADHACFADLLNEARPLVLGSRGRVPPDRRHQRTGDQVPGLQLPGELLQVRIRGIDVHVRSHQEQIDAVEFHAVDLRRGSEVDHPVQFDDGVGRVRSLSDYAGPGCVVQFRIVVGVAHGTPPPDSVKAADSGPGFPDQSVSTSRWGRSGTD